MTVGKSNTQAHALHTEQKTNLRVVLADPILLTLNGQSINEYSYLHVSTSV